MESFIIGGLTALVAALAVLGWKFLTRKELSDTALLVRIIVEVCILAINVIFIFIMIIGMATFDMSENISENTSGFISAILIFGVFYVGICVLFGKFLYRDIKERARRKNPDSFNDEDNRDDEDF